MSRFIASALPFFIGIGVGLIAWGLARYGDFELRFDKNKLALKACSSASGKALAELADAPKRPME